MAVGGKNLRGCLGPMEKLLESVVCPVCKGSLILAEYPSKRGWRLLCKGAGHRVRIYAEFFKNAVMPEAPAPVAEMPRTSRTKELLERAARLAA